MRKLYIKSQFLVLFSLLFFISSLGFAQNDLREKPISFSLNLSDTTPKINIPPLSAKMLINDTTISKNIFAKYIKVNIGFENGKWETLRDGSRLWRLLIHSEDAKQLNVKFDKFRLPKGGKLFIYNTQKIVLGDAITEKNNNSDNKFTAPYILGDSIILEYFQPLNVEFTPDFHISAIGYDFTKLIENTNNPSASCQININCPANGNLNPIKNAVFKYGFDLGDIDASGFCTGTLVNNTKQDGKPLFLTAKHCINGLTNQNLSQIVGYFLYENEGTQCYGINNPDAVILYGGVKTISQWADTDFALLEFNNNIPASTQAYFADWDSSDGAENGTFVIHHPSADVKKFSKDYNSPSKVSKNNWTDGFPLVFAWETQVDYGADTEGGSSGSAIFSNDNQLLIGQLKGSDSGDPCNLQHKQWYGRLAHSWNGGNTSTTRLKEHLDPLLIGNATLAGNNCPNITPSSLVSSELTDYSANLSWDVGYITPYTLNYRKKGETNWQSETVYESSTTLYSLDIDTNYEWRVKTRCSSYSDIKTFKTYPTFGDIAFSKYVYCQGQSSVITLPIEGSQYIYSFNSFTVELSDASGSFSFPTVIGYKSGRDANDIPITIPNNIPSSTKYRVRIVLDFPSYTKNSAYDVAIGIEPAILQATTTCPDSYTSISRLWEKAYGGNKEDELRQTIPTNDGGTLLFGSSKSESSSSTDKSDVNRGNYDYWLVKMDGNNNKVWDRALGGTDADLGSIIIPTADGGYLLGGSSYSGSSGDKTQDNAGGNNGTADYWVVKVSSNGYKIWDKRFGGSLNDELKVMIQTPDGGFLLAGRSNSPANGSKNKANYNGSYDFWIMKITGNGTIVTDWVFGGNAEENLTSFIQTSDGGYLLGGHSKSDNNGGDISEQTRLGWDYWIVKVDANFNKLWDKRYGGGADDLMATNGIAVASDGNYIIAGRSDSNVTGDKNEPSWFNTPDYWVLKVNSQDRSIIKQHRFGGGGEDGCNSLLATPDGGFLLAGGSNSNATGNKSEPSWSNTYDYWIVKVDANLEMKWNKRFGGGGDDYGMTLSPTLDGNFMVGGFSNSNKTGDKNADFSKGLTDYWLVKFNDCQTSNSTTVNVGQKAFLSANGCLGTITWSNGATTNNIVVSPTINTTYTATCYYGCASNVSSVLTISVDPCPTIYTLTSPNDDYVNSPIILKAKATNGSLNAKNKITGTSNVLYEGKNVTLNAGFEAKQGSVFKAQVGGCN